MGLQKLSPAFCTIPTTHSGEPPEARGTTLYIRATLSLPLRTVNCSSWICRAQRSDAQLGEKSKACLHRAGRQGGRHAARPHAFAAHCSAASLFTSAYSTALLPASLLTNLAAICSGLPSWRLRHAVLALLVSCMMQEGPRRRHHQGLKPSTRPLQGPPQAAGGAAHLQLVPNQAVVACGFEPATPAAA